MNGPGSGSIAPTPSVPGNRKPLPVGIPSGRVAKDEFRLIPGKESSSRRPPQVPAMSNTGIEMAAPMRVDQGHRGRGRRAPFLGPAGSDSGRTMLAVPPEFGTRRRGRLLCPHRSDKPPPFPCTPDWDGTAVAIGSMSTKIDLGGVALRSPPMKVDSRILCIARWEMKPELLGRLRQRIPLSKSTGEVKLEGPPNE